MRSKVILLFLAINIAGTFAQTLTLEDALHTALKNNYGILVSKNDSAINRANNTPGNAGMLPVIQFTGSGSVGQNNIYQKLSTGTTSYPNQLANNVSAGVELDWTLFDGGKMFITKRKLAETESLGIIQLHEKVLQTQFDVIAAYYEIVIQQQQLANIRQIISYNRERVKLISNGFNSGYYQKSDYLQAQIDLNVSLEDEISQLYTIDAARRNLNVLLGRDNSTAFEVVDSIPLKYSPERTTLLNKTDSTNTTLLSLISQVKIATLTLDENKTGYFPKLSFKAGYYFSNSGYSVGNTLTNRSFGPSVGGTLSIPLFSAGENNRKIKIAELQKKSTEYTLKNTRLQIHTDLENALTNFDNQQKLLTIEKKNFFMAKENLEISMQRLSMGQTTSLEVHQAQEFYVQSATRLISFEYNLKMAESLLKQLSSNF